MILQKNTLICTVFAANLFFSMPFGLNAFDPNNMIADLKKKEEAELTNLECQVKCLEDNQGQVCLKKCKIAFIKKKIEILKHLDK